MITKRMSVYIARRFTFLQDTENVPRLGHEARTSLLSQSTLGPESAFIVVNVEARVLGFLFLD